MTLEEIITKEQQNRHEAGQFGIDACKESIQRAKDIYGLSYYEQLEDMVKRANTDVFFNKQMVLACWELINER